MKVLVGTGDVAGMTYEITRGFRALSIKADSLVRAESKYYKKKHRYTFNFATVSRWLEIDSIKSSTLRGILKAFERMTAFVLILFCFPYFLIRYSHIILLSVESTFLYRLDLPVFKFFGKKIIFFCVGSDVRHLSAFHQEIGGDLNTWEDIFKKRNINWNIRNLRNAEFFGSSVFSVPDQSGLALRPYYHLPIPMDVSRYKYRITGNEIPKIVHAPSRKGAKGTDKILAVMEKLKADGYQFTWTFLTGVPNQVVLDALTEADILIDEIYAHGPAKLGFEAMASGCAVANRFYKGSFAYAMPPVCAIDENNLYEPIKKLITDRLYRERLSVEGRKYVETYQTPEVVTRRILDCINNIPPYDYYPAFYLKKYKLPVGASVSKKYQLMGKKIVLQHGASCMEDIQRGIHEKLLAPFTEEELKKVRIWEQS